MFEQQSLNIQAIVDLLSRRKPELLCQLKEKYPSHKGLLSPGKMLGTETVPQDKLLIDLAVNTVRNARQECTDTYKLVVKQLRTSARLRLGAAIISSASSCGVIAALMQESHEIALITGALALMSSIFALIAQYKEEYAGGQNSLREMRERVAQCVADSAEVEGEIGLIIATGDSEGIELQIRKLNTVIASTRQIQIAIT